MNNLPSFLEERDGAVYIRGHRISLFTLMEADKQNQVLADEFPTVPADVLGQVLTFSRQHPDVSAYYDAQLKIAAANRAKYGDAPPLDEMRARMASHTVDR